MIGNNRAPVKENEREENIDQESFYTNLVN